MLASLLKSPLPIRPLGVLVLLGAAAAWQLQEWRFGLRLQEQARLHQQVLARQEQQRAAQRQAEHSRRQTLERHLQVLNHTHYTELSDAQAAHARLRDRLARTEQRLSVVTHPAPGNRLPAASAGALVHDAAPGRLDPAHAQRIVDITHAGDQGLIALAACQAYVKALAGPG